MCNVVYHLLTSNADEEQLAEIDRELAAPIDPRYAEAQKKVQATLSNLGRLR